ncbi:MAG: retropepsin-like aspartic protease, partial [Bacteroidota bacterium]
MKQLFISLLLWLLSCLGNISSAAQPIATVAFELEGEHMFIKLRVNDSEELDFIFDTGAGGSAINATTARRLNLSNRKKKMASGAAGTFKVGVIKNARIQINDLELEKVNLESPDLLHLECALGRDIDGIIGYHVLKDHVVSINHDRSEMDIYAAEGFVYQGTGQIFPIKVGTHASIDGRLTLENGAQIAGEFILDNGAGVALAFCTPFANKHDLLSKIEGGYAMRAVGYST